MCSRQGHLLQWNGQQDHMHLVEGWMSTHRCQWIADQMTTTTAHSTGMWLQDHWGNKWEYTPPCQAPWCWIVIYFDVGYSCSTPRGPVLPVIWWLNLLTLPVQELNLASDYTGMRACPEKKLGGRPIWGTPTQTEIFLYIAVNSVNSMTMLCYVIIQIHRCYVKIVQAVI